ncbi:MAG: S8 family serine peptidase, partial [Xanthobacteraceae bacterium]
GPHIALAAPGDQILVALPDGGYEVSSGTSYAAAEVSGIVALLLQRDPALTPDKARAILMATAKDLGAKGRDPEFGAGLADAYGAVMAEKAPAEKAPMASASAPGENSNTGSR